MVNGLEDMYEWKTDQRLRVVDKQLRDSYRLHDPETLIVNIKKGGKSWTLAELVPAIESHMRNHHQQLKKEFV